MMIARDMMRATIRVNESLFRRRAVPRLYDAALDGKIRYGSEPWAPAYEDFANAGQVLQRGWGDCDDLAPYRCAELRVLGDPRFGIAPCRIVRGKCVAHAPKVFSGELRPSCADVRIYTRPDSGVFHCEVRRPDGVIEDPSRLLGMGGRLRET